jgi:hypothetical protein
MNKYENTELASYVLTLDSDVETKFKTLNEERWRNYNMLVTSRQWDPIDKEILDEANRPAFAYNLISPIIKTIRGYQVGGRKRLMVAGIEEKDYANAQAANKVLDWAWNVCKVDNEFTKAATDAIIGRWGFLYHHWTFEDDPLGLPLIERVDPFRLTFDMSSDWEKCQFVKDQSWLTIEELLSHYAIGNDDMAEEMLEKARAYFAKDPTKRKNLVSTFIEKLGSYATQWWKGEDNASRPPDYDSMYQYYNADNGRFKTIELHEKRMQIRTFIYDTITGIETDVTEQIRPDKSSDLNAFDNAKLQKFREKYTEDAKKLAAVKGGFFEPNVIRKQVKQTWITSVIPAFNMVVNDEPYKVQNGRFMYEKIEAYNFHADPMQVQSVVDELIDIQRDYNKARSTMLEYLSKHASVGYTAEADAIGPFEDMWLNPKMGGLKYVVKGGLDKVKPDQVPALPSELVRSTMENRDLMYVVPGINQASQGQVESKTETGRLFLAKKEQSEVMMTTLFDNFDIALENLGQGIMADINFFMGEDRKIRVTGEDGKTETLVVNERMPDGTVKNNVADPVFDLKISREPYGRTARERAFERLGELVAFIGQFNPQLMPKLLPIIIKASDNPYKNEILQAISEDMQSTAQAQQQMQQVAQAQAEIELVKNQAMVAEKQAATAERAAKAEGQQLENKIMEKNLDAMNLGADLAGLIKNTLTHVGA